MARPAGCTALAAILVLAATVQAAADAAPTGAAPAEPGARLAADLGAAMRHIEAYLLREADADEAAPGMVEAAVRAGRDPAAWPAGRPALAAVDPPAAGDLEPAALRSGYALALAGRLGAEEPVVQAVLAASSDAQFGDALLLTDDAWSLRLLLAAGIPADNATVAAAAGLLAQRQSADGGWAPTLGSPSTADQTGLVVEVLAAAGALGNRSAAAVRFLDGLETGSGARPFADGKPNCSSIAWALRARLATGTAPPAGAVGGLALLASEGGGYAFAAGGQAHPTCTPGVVAALHLALSRGLDMAEYEGYREAGGPPRAAGAAAPPAAALALVLLLSAAWSSDKRYLVPRP